MPHYQGQPSSALSPESRLRQKISNKLQELRQCADAVLLQSNEDPDEVKFYLARAQRRLKAIRFLVAQLAVMPQHQSGHDKTTTIVPVERAKQVLSAVEQFEASLAPYFAKFPDLPLDFMSGVLKYPAKI